MMKVETTFHERQHSRDNIIARNMFGLDCYIEESLNPYTYSGYACHLCKPESVFAKPYGELPAYDKAMSFQYDKRVIEASALLSGLSIAVQYLDSNGEQDLAELLICLNLYIWSLTNTGAPDMSEEASLSLASQIEETIARGASPRDAILEVENNNFVRSFA